AVGKAEAVDSAHNTSDAVGGLPTTATHGAPHAKDMRGEGGQLVRQTRKAAEIRGQLDPAAKRIEERGDFLKDHVDHGWELGVVRMAHNSVEPWILWTHNAPPATNAPGEKAGWQGAGEVIQKPRDQGSINEPILEVALLKHQAHQGLLRLEIGGRGGNHARPPVAVGNLGVLEPADP